jgi:hypothetical protein
MYHAAGICPFFLPISQQESENWEACSHSETRKTAPIYEISSFLEVSFGIILLSFSY